MWLIKMSVDNIKEYTSMWLFLIIRMEIVLMLDIITY